GCSLDHPALSGPGSARGEVPDRYARRCAAGADVLSALCAALPVRHCAQTCECRLPWRRARISLGSGPARRQRGDRRYRAGRRNVDRKATERLAQAEVRKRTTFANQFLTLIETADMAINRI